MEKVMGGIVLASMGVVVGGMLVVGAILIYLLEGTKKSGKRFAISVLYALVTIYLNAMAILTTVASVGAWRGI